MVKLRSPLLRCKEVFVECLLLFVCSPPMCGEFATFEWRVAVLSVGLVSIFVVSAVPMLCVLSRF